MDVIKLGAFVHYVSVDRHLERSIRVRAATQTVPSCVRDHKDVLAVAGRHACGISGAFPLVGTALGDHRDAV